MVLGQRRANKVFKSCSQRRTSWLSQVFLVCCVILGQWSMRQNAILFGILWYYKSTTKACSFSYLFGFCWFFDLQRDWAAVRRRCRTSTSKFQRKHRIWENQVRLYSHQLYRNLNKLIFLQRDIYIWPSNIRKSPWMFGVCKWIHVSSFLLPFIDSEAIPKPNPFRITHSSVWKNFLAIIENISLVSLTLKYRFCNPMLI